VKNTKNNIQDTLENEIDKHVENNNPICDLPNVGTIMKKTFETSKIVTTDTHHDCFSRNIYNNYVVLQVMYAGQRYHGEYGGKSESMFIVEFINKDDYEMEMRKTRNNESK
jgi:hypothetical protein